MEGTDPEVQNSGGTKGRVEGDCYGGPKMVSVQRDEWRGTDLEVPR